MPLMGKKYTKSLVAQLQKHHEEIIDHNEGQMSKIESKYGDHKNFPDDIKKKYSAHADQISHHSFAAQHLEDYWDKYHTKDKITKE